MKVTINNAAIELNGSSHSLEMAISQSGVKDFKGLAIAVNNVVIPRTTWDAFNLKENDSVTIIRATQGG